MQSELVPYRLLPQHLYGEPLNGAAAAVGHLGAVQSQLFDMSLWGLSRRTGLTLAELLESFEHAEFVRTHVLRPTWHHVLAADLRDLLEVTAPRVRMALDNGWKQLGLPAGESTRAALLVIEAVRDEGPLTRQELGARLADAGVTWTGNGLAHIVMEAELTGEIGSGPMRGKQHTYVATDLPASGRAPDERLAWLARTYVGGHGPARPQDLAWWSSITLTQARRAFELAELSPVALAGHELWATEQLEPPEAVDVPAAMLLPNFDELISYARAPGAFGLLTTDAALRAAGLLFLDGSPAGSWGRTVAKAAVTVTVQPAVPLTRAAEEQVGRDAEAFGRFVGREARLEIVGP